MLNCFYVSNYLLFTRIYAITTPNAYSCLSSHVINFSHLLSTSCAHACYLIYNTCCSVENHVDYQDDDLEF
uniref:Uncharacterized protein n=1 Tax=Arundo donax TaxID=35708 RepID=A0A0A9C2H9_ARUDO